MCGSRPSTRVTCPEAINKKGDEFIFDSTCVLYFWGTPDNAERALVRGGFRAFFGVLCLSPGSSLSAAQKIMLGTVSALQMSS